MTAKTLAAWKKAANHTVQLPSGFEATVRVPDIGQMVSKGLFPSELRDAIVDMQAEVTDDTAPTPEQLATVADWTRHIVRATVMDPALELAEVDDLPTEDRDMLVRIANREVHPASLVPKTEGA